MSTDNEQSRTKAPCFSSSLQRDLLENFDVYDPETCSNVLHFSNGDFYKGETLGELRHGKGKHTCTNGDTHEGAWYKGMRHGPGIATFARGFTYEGEFQYDHAHGSGKAKYENGSVYDGEFASDQRSGWGMQGFPDESVYVGEWSGDCMQGKGRLAMKDGSFYEGTWRSGQLEKGVWRSADRQQEYTGEWVRGRKEGCGMLTVEKLFQYSGEWKDDVQSGEGTCRWVDGSVYKGAWLEGNRHGRGRLVRADGYRYEGDWQNDNENGEGNARLTNGDRCTGSFKDGLPHGQARARTVDGDRYEGDWERGKRHGKGRCIFANGDRYQGDWVADKRSGSGVCQFADGRLFKGQWQDDHWLQSEAEPSLCKVSGVGIARSVAGAQTSFRIMAKDSLGNTRLSGGDKFVVWLEGPTTVHGTLIDNGDGSVTAKYSTTVAGMYELYITNDTGESVADAPYPLRVLAAAPEPRKSTIRTKVTPAMSDGRPCTFLVEACDQYGNRCKVSDVAIDMPISIEISNGSLAVEAAVEATNSGYYTCSFHPPAPGFYRVEVTSAGKQLCNSPFSIQVKSAGSRQNATPLETPVIVDSVREWEKRAAEQYAADGCADGWDSDTSEPETAEQRYIREHPDVPVVEDLGDMWKVTKLQKERKARADREKAQQERRELLNEEHLAQPVTKDALLHDEAAKTEPDKRATGSISERSHSTCNIGSKISDTSMESSRCESLQATSLHSKGEVATLSSQVSSTLSSQFEPLSIGQPDEKHADINVLPSSD